jgi:integration host factor subunit beta
VQQRKKAGEIRKMTKSELIDRLSEQHKHLKHEDVELAVKSIIEQMSGALADGDRIEIRGFGSFSLHYRAPRMGRNPKTGEAVALPGKHVPHFKPGKLLRVRVDSSEPTDN